ncbi:MAG: SOS response-associated peptidase [Legionellales bacterium]|nr:SOS response-associated peptidase [Legionellales bacterium]
MCGRFVVQADKKEIEEYFSVNINIPYTKNYNVSPSQQIYCIYLEKKQYTFTTMSWGLVPEWADLNRINTKPINARVETITGKPFFRKAIQHKRMIIIASGYYEWKKEENHKQPYYIYSLKSPILPLAGIWSEKFNEAYGEIYRSCAIITEISKGTLKSIHNRKPIILQKNIINDWFNDNYLDILQNTKTHSLPEETLNFYQVSRQVNNPQNNDPNCVKKLYQ